MATYTDITGIIGGVVSQLNIIYDTNEHLIKSHADAIAQAKQMDGDSIGNVPQTF